MWEWLKSHMKYNVYDLLDSSLKQRNKNTIDNNYYGSHVAFPSLRTAEVLKSLTPCVQREFSSNMYSADFLLIVLVLNSAPPAHFWLCLFCSDLYKDGYFLLSRHILKVFCLCLIKGSVCTDSVYCPAIALTVSFSCAISADLWPWLLVFWK